MKAQNHKAVTKGYLFFSCYLAACVVVGVLAYYSYTQTSLTEVGKIDIRTREYNEISVLQNELSDEIDELFMYISQLNTGKNDKGLMDIIGDRKPKIMKKMHEVDNREVKTHRRLMVELDIFLGIKDSIRTAKSEEEYIKNELRECIKENGHLSNKIKRTSIK